MNIGFWTLPIGAFFVFDDAKIAYLVLVFCYCCYQIMTAIESIEFVEEDDDLSIDHPPYPIED